MYKVINQIGGLASAISDKQYQELGGNYQLYYAYAGNDPEPAEGTTDEEDRLAHQNALNQSAGNGTQPDAKEVVDQDGKIQNSEVPSDEEKDEILEDQKKTDAELKTQGAADVQDQGDETGKSQNESQG